MVTNTFLPLPQQPQAEQLQATVFKQTPTSALAQCVSRHSSALQHSTMLDSSDLSCTHWVACAVSAASHGVLLPQTLGTAWLLHRSAWGRTATNETSHPAILLYPWSVSPCCMYTCALFPASKPAHNGGDDPAVCAEESLPRVVMHSFSFLLSIILYLRSEVRTGQCED